jgi:hypothetical protein
MVPNLLWELAESDPELGDALRALRARALRALDPDGDRVRTPTARVPPPPPPVPRVPIGQGSLNQRVEIGAPASAELEDRGAVLASKRPAVASIVGIVVAVALIGAGLSLLWIFAGSRAVPFLVRHRQAFALGFGAALVCSGFPLLGLMLRTAPNGRLDPRGAEPVSELSRFADRCAQRHHVAYRLQMTLVVATALLLLGLVVWSIVLVTLNRLQYGIALGGGSAGGVILTSTKWQPFDRAARARKDADRADVLAVGLRTRLRTIAAITDPRERHRAEWEAIRDFTQLHDGDQVTERAA